MPVQRPTTVKHRTSLFEEAADIVEQDFSTELSLDDIARRVASSRRQLQRAFSEVGHTTFREYLTRVRMRRAAEMLATGDLTVREVAHRVGYRQPAQFAKAFRRATGASPSAYRVEGAPEDGHGDSANGNGWSANGNSNGASRYFRDPRVAPNGNGVFGSQRSSYAA